MKKELLIFVILCFLAKYDAAQTYINGNISSNTTWSVSGNPYIVQSSVTVLNGITLTTEAGVEVRFEDGAGMMINGVLTSNNTTFKPNNSSPTAGVWGRIQVGDWNNTGEANLTDCSIQYATMVYVEKGVLNATNIIITDFSDNGIVVNNGQSANVSGQIMRVQNYGIFMRDAANVNTSNLFISSCYMPVRLDGIAQWTSVNCDFTGNTYNQAGVYFTNVNANWLLPYINVPYVLHSGMTVNNGMTMTIAPNNIVKFPNDQGIAVHGTLIADAGNGEAIYFTSYQDDNWGGDNNADGTASAPNKNNWWGIKFHDDSNDAASVMRRCYLRYAGSSYWWGQNGAAIMTESASPTIDWCDISNNYYGVAFWGASDPVFTNNTIGSSDIVPIAMSVDANPTFSNNTFSFSDNQYDAIGLFGGTLSRNTILPVRQVVGVDNVTYLMLGTLTVPQNITLTINQGIVIKSFSDRNLVVNGTLVADGSPEMPIVFTSTKDDNDGGDTNKDGTTSFPSKGDIGGIVFTATSTNSIMDNCRIKYARMAGYDFMNNSKWVTVNWCAIAAIDASPVISNCEFKDLWHGVSCYRASAPTITDNQLINCEYTPFAISGSSNPTFNNNTFMNCTMNALGLIGGEMAVSGTLYKKDLSGYTNITYVLLSDLTITNGTYLKIEEGVVIKSNGPGIFVNGGLHIAGTVLAPVVITSLLDDNVGNPNDTNGDGNATSPSPGQWWGIQFNESSDDNYSKFDNCEIKFMGWSYWSSIWGWTYSGIDLYNASPSFNNTLITDARGFGVRLVGNTASVFSGVTIQNCDWHPVAMSLLSNPTFNNVVFTANESQGLFILEGSLASDATLAKRDVAGIQNIAYIVDDLNILSDAKLTISPGVVIKMRGTITVNGALDAKGTTDQKIIFTSFADDSKGGDTNNDGNNSSPNTANWGSIIFKASGRDSENVIQNAEVRYSTNGIETNNSYANIDHCTISFATWGLRCFGSAHPDITNTDIYNAFCPIYMSMFAQPVFSNISLANISLTAIWVHPEVYSQDGTFPVRNIGEFNNITYYLSGTYTVNTGTHITIPAGLVFKTRRLNVYWWSDDANIVVNGKLTIAGTAQNPVVFTKSADDTYGSPKDSWSDGKVDWTSNGANWITFNDVSDDQSSIKNTIFRYAPSGIGATSASPVIDSCSFEYSPFGVSMDGVSEPVIDNCIFNNLDYTPFSISLVAYPASTNNAVVSGTTWRGIGVKGETLTQDITLPKRALGDMVNAPYVFKDGYTVGTSATLTVESGVICKIGGTFDVYKALDAQGTATADGNIVFTAIGDDFYGGDTDADGSNNEYDRWNGIVFHNESLDPLCHLKYCSFHNINLDYWSNRAAITTQNASPTIEYCSFVDTYNGVRLEGSSNPTINYCDFKTISNLAIDNTSQTFTINAENCWWGNNSGPAHSGNPDGTGATVTDGVDYTPWLVNGMQNPTSGDISLNGLIQAYDASLLLQYLVGATTLNANQLTVADVSASNTVSAYDASLILQYVVGTISHFPSELLKESSIQSASDATLTIADARVNTGETFTLPIRLNTIGDLFAFQLELRYDASLLELIGVSNTAIVNEMTVMVQQQSGIVKIAAAGDKPLNFDDVVTLLTFRISQTNTQSNYTAIKANLFVANETLRNNHVYGGNIEIQNVTTSILQNLDNSSNIICIGNPVGNQSVISYHIENNHTAVQLGVYNLQGKCVAELANGFYAQGNYTIRWNTTATSHIENGFYLLVLKAGNSTWVQKIQVVK